MDRRTFIAAVAAALAAVFLPKRRPAVQPVSFYYKPEDWKQTWREADLVYLAPQTKLVIGQYADYCPCCMVKEEEI